MLSLQDSELLMAIAQAGMQPEAWSAALQQLATYVQADGAVLYLPEGGWDQDGAVSSPWPEGLVGLRLGRVYSAEELVERASPIALGASDLRAIGMASGWLVVTRRKGTFRAVDSAALSAFAPHVAQALQAGAVQAQIGARLAAHDLVARRLGLGLVHLDAADRVLVQDNIARALLDRAGVKLAGIAQGVQMLAPGLEVAVLPLPDGTRLLALRATDLELPPPQVLARALGISLAEARLARALGMGDTLAEAAQRLGLTIETARAYSKQIFLKTGLRGQPDLMRRLWAGALVLG